jgi:hypothetical protein
MTDIDYDEERSTDGSDSEGSLVDFIVGDDGEEADELESEDDGKVLAIDDEVNDLLSDRVALVESAQVVDGCRRSTRKRKATVRFEDEMAKDKEYQRTMKKFAHDAESLSEDDGEDTAGGEEDEDFEQEDEASGTEGDSDTGTED